MSNIIELSLFFTYATSCIILGGKFTVHTSVSEHNLVLHSMFLRYNVQGFKENKPKETFAREYCFQWSIFINYKHKHVKFLQGLLLDQTFHYLPLNFLSSYFLLNSLGAATIPFVFSWYHLTCSAIFCLDIGFLHFHPSDTLYLAPGPFVTMTTTSWYQQRISLVSEGPGLIKCRGCCLNWCLLSCAQERSFVYSLLYFIREAGKANFLC